VIPDGWTGNGIDWVSVAYQPKNVAPVIDGIAVQDPGVRAQASQIIIGQAGSVALRQPPAPNPTGIVITSSTTKFEQTPQATTQKGFQTVVWTAHDDNDDDLRFAVYFRGEKEKDWLLLKDN